MEQVRTAGGYDMTFLKSLTRRRSSQHIVGAGHSMDGICRRHIFALLELNQHTYLPVVNA